MTITLYNMTSPENKIGKTMSAVYPSMTGHLKNECSRSNPVVRIEGNIDGMSSCNYMYIEDFGRYYFVTDIVSIRTDIVEVHGRVDVLESFKDSILNEKVILKRQRDNWNLYVEDGSFITYAKDKMYTVNFPAGFDQANCYVLVTAGY